jgi:hypothetical protein
MGRDNTFGELLNPEDWFSWDTLKE